jgi:hypothetical protein
MYHDKHFQKDSHFALIAFNHEQIKQSTSSGYLLAETPKFNNISKRLMDVDVEVLSHLIQRMEDGERVKPETDEESLGFQLIKDLDHVSGRVQGSTTPKNICAMKSGLSSHSLELHLGSSHSLQLITCTPYHCTLLILRKDLVHF